MLDSIKGGQSDSGLFSGPTDPQGDRYWTEVCKDDCKEGLGSVNGTVKGTVFPEPD